MSQPKATVEIYATRKPISSISVSRERVFDGMKTGGAPVVAHGANEDAERATVLLVESRSMQLHVHLDTRQPSHSPPDGVDQRMSDLQEPVGASRV